MFEALATNLSSPIRSLSSGLRINGDSRLAIEDLEHYRIIGVTNRGGGVAIKRTVTGSELTMREYQYISANQLMWCKVDTKNGAFGITREEHVGSLASPNMCLTDIDLKVFDPKFLQFFFQLPAVIDGITTASLGTTNRQYLKPQEFLDRVRLRLPPLPEQRRIVVRIEELAGKINEARRLRESSVEEAERLLVCMAHRRDLNDTRKGAQGWQRVRLGDVMKYVDDSYPVQSDLSFPNVGIYSFGRGLFRKPPIDGALTSATTLRRVRKGQFIYSRLFAFEGAYGLVSDEFDCYFVSNEYPTFDCDPNRVRVEFIAAYFKSPFAWKEIAAGSKGLGDRRQRVQPEQILSHNVWLPPMNWQNRIAEVQREMDVLKKLQAETAAELDALLPSILDKAFKGEI